MIAVDASSLILLAKASVLGRAVAIEEAAIGQEVYGECVTRGKAKGEADALLIEQLVAANRIAVKPADQTRRAELERLFGLRGGENETLALAQEHRCPAIMDDKRGLVACRLLGVPCLIALDVIVDLYENQHLSKPEAEQAIAKVKAAGWLRDDIVAAREKRIREGKQ